MKRYENQWSWVTLSVDVENNKIHFYLNGKESDDGYGHGTHSPQPFDGKLKDMVLNHILLEQQLQLVKGCK